MYMKKNNVPTDTLTVRIETDYEGNPSGNLISPSAQISVNPTALSTGWDWIMNQFPGSLKFEK